MTVRSVRNNNPMNLRVGQPWLGLCPPDEMTEEQKEEQTFCVFKSPDYGFRAGALTLLTYFRKYKLKSVYSIISRFAPANENDTQAYVSDVSDKLGVLSSVPINVEDLGTLTELCKAIAVHEGGAWLFDNVDLASGVSMALGIVEPPDNSNALVA